MSLQPRADSLAAPFYHDEILHTLSLRLAEIGAEYARLDLDERSRRRALGDWMLVARNLRQSWEDRRGY